MLHIDFLISGFPRNIIKKEKDIKLQTKSNSNDILETKMRLIRKYIGHFENNN